jgi:hypothetical protein
MSWGVDLEEPDGEVVEVFDGHTYNLSPMWRLAGVFEGSSSELDGMLAAEVAVLARLGLHRVDRDEAAFEALNPPNHWGDFEGFVRILTLTAETCEEHPTAIVRWNG